MKELILGQIPDNFDHNRHIAISPACFIGKEHIFPEFEKLDFINVIPNVRALVHFDQLATKEALYWVNIIAQKYNPDEFYKHSFRFWKTIYIPWLGMVIPWIYRKALLVDKLIEKYKEEEIILELIDIDTNITFTNEINFIIDGFWNTTVNFWVISRLLEKNIPPKWNVKKKISEVKSDTKTISRFNNKNNIKQLVVDKLNKIFYRCNRIYGFSKWNELFFHLLLSVKPTILKSKNEQIPPQHNFIKWDFDILRILNVLIPNSLKYLNLEKTKTRKYEKGKLVNYSNSLYYNIERKIDAAFAYDNGEIVLTTQHGGHNYGSALTFEFGKEIEYKSDYFISWGWEEEGLNIITLPSPLLSKKINLHKKKNDYIIFVGTDMAGFQTRFDSGSSEISFLEYRRNKITFLEGLNNTTLSDLLYRPYPEKETSFLDSKYILKKIPNIKIHKGNLHKGMQMCNMVVLDHPGTTWNIAMAMNTPLICFWNRDHFPFNEKANSFLDEFESLGLFYEDPEKAADRVNTLIRQYSDLSVWWNQKEIQDLRKRWMHQYARADKKWFWIWTKKLWQLK